MQFLLFLVPYNLPPLVVTVPQPQLREVMMVPPQEPHPLVNTNNPQMLPQPP